MSEGQFLELPPFNANSFVMIQGIYTSKENFREAVKLTLLLVFFLDRTPILPVTAGAPHKHINLEKLSVCAGKKGFKLAPFLNGQFYLNRTSIPTKFNVCNSNTTLSHLKTLHNHTLLLISDATTSLCDASFSDLHNDFRNELPSSSKIHVSTDVLLEKIKYLNNDNTESIISCVENS